MSYPRTSDALVNVSMDQCLFQYNLETKISSIVVDNCTTDDLMMAMLLGKFDSSSLILMVNFCICGVVLTF